MGIFTYKNIIYISNKSTMLLTVLLAGLLIMGCSTNRRLSRSVGRDLKLSEILKQHHVGFALFDPQQSQMIFQQNSDKYFIPISNTKLFNFYAGLKMLRDSVPALRYVVRNDSLIFWGTGDPSFLQSRLRGVNGLAFLKASDKKLFFSPGRYTGELYGKGWAWDDYSDYYQAGISELPLMDNLVSIKAQKEQFSVVPKLFADCFVRDSNAVTGPFTVKRELDQNRFNYPNVKIPEGYTQEIPYKLSLAATLNILADTLQKEIGVIHLRMPLDAKTVYSKQRDSVLKEMMLPSDNFIAEQLMLVYANQLGEELNTEKTIRHILKTYLTALPDKPVWVDGSGLSRMNLFTPRDIVMVLDLIYKEVNNPVRLFDMMPAGGRTGTLRNAYPKTDQPFVHAKTGTFSNNYNQSGYVQTKKGKTYIFVFMNNNFEIPLTTLKKEMARIITGIHEHF